MRTVTNFKKEIFWRNLLWREIMMKITYVYHSCYVVELEEVVFVFDYYKGELPTWDIRKKVIFFASHKHQDHFSLEIFSFAKKYQDITYILSNDIRFTDNFLIRHNINPCIREKIIRIGKRTSRELDVQGKCLRIETLRSTDEGVAFLIHYNNKSIYHAGDLNWWSWSGITEQENEEMAKAYKREINTLANQKIDIAFLVLDPRKEERYWWGMDYFLKTVEVDCVFPMHCWEKYSIIKQFQKDKGTAAYITKVQDVTAEEEFFEI